MVKKKILRIMVDMSTTFLHYGHIRLLKKAKKLGFVIVALTTDKEIEKAKCFTPEISYRHRKEILESIKYVDEVVSSKWVITDSFLKKHNIDFLVHGDDNSNLTSPKKTIIYKRTNNVSARFIRKKILKNLL